VKDGSGLEAPRSCSELPANVDNGVIAVGIVGRAVSKELWLELKPRQERIDAALQSVLLQVTGACPEAIRDAMAYSLLAPGKRLRPLLVMLTCEAAGGTIEQSLPAACAVEMVHTYSLIHDDLPAMDDDDLRRGLPTSHKKFGEALAILTGDALLTSAFEVLAGGYESRTAAVSCVELARGAGAVGMVGGQTLDLQFEGRIKYTGKSSPSVELIEPFIDRLEETHARKTGALFRSSLRLGVYAAQAERTEGIHPKTLAAADQFAATFGLAFQVTDDLLDVVSTADKTGKRVGKDAARGKLTYPRLLGVEESRRKASELGRQAVVAAEQLGSLLLADLAQYVVTRER
jgi:geranylgeranyl diphosphate synthase type II